MSAGLPRIQSKLTVVTHHRAIKKGSALKRKAKAIDMGKVSVVVTEPEKRTRPKRNHRLNQRKSRLIVRKKRRIKQRRQGKKLLLRRRMLRGRSKLTRGNKGLTRTASGKISLPMVHPPLNRPGARPEAGNPAKEAKPSSPASLTPEGGLRPDLSPDSAAVAPLAADAVSLLEQVGAILPKELPGQSSPEQFTLTGPADATALGVPVEAPANEVSAATAVSSVPPSIPNLTAAQPEGIPAASIPAEAAIGAAQGPEHAWPITSDAQELFVIPDENVVPDPAFVHVLKAGTDPVDFGIEWRRVEADEGIGSVLHPDTISRLSEEVTPD
ncbi:hypothetical protein ACFQ3W_18530 [Paenibacillus puldeungensis]|uniref:Uncharacterized protein n=1 Tax=Paenibacillus puldeungensis TaxID=696536 RepID=A0ABW3S1J6_9BACL